MAVELFEGVFHQAEVDVDGVGEGGGMAAWTRDDIRRDCEHSWMTMVLCCTHNDRREKLYLFGSAYEHQQNRISGNKKDEQDYKMED